MKRPTPESNRHRIIALALVVLLGLALWVIEKRGADGTEKALGVVQSIQDAQCVAGNASRLTTFNEAKAEELEAEAFAGQEHDPEIAALWHKRARRKAEVQVSILAAAEQRGALLDPNQPVINCE